MLTPKQEALLRAASEKTLARIQQDHQRASRRVKPFMAYIKENLLDPELGAAQALRHCEIRDKAFPSLFRSEMRHPPWKYVIRRRMKIGCWLLRNTNLEIGLIGRMVGYPDHRNFTRAFGKLHKMPPRVYRQRARLKAEGKEVPEGPAFTGEDLQRALDGELELARAEALIAHLRETYRLKPRVPSRGAVAEGHERRMAENLWRQIHDRPFEAQKRIVRRQIAFTTPALFDFLRHKSREEGRDDRQRGIQLAELALEALEACAPAVGNRLQDLRALGWASLANARRLALGFSDAEVAIERAEIEWGSGERDRLVESEIAALKAVLRMNQRRFEEAVVLANRAIALFEKNGERYSCAEAYALRGNIRYNSGEAEAAIPDYRKALDLLEERDPPRLELLVRHNLAGNYALNGNFEAAAAVLPEDVSEISTEALIEYQLVWMRGLVAHGQGDRPRAEALFVLARENFVRLQEEDHAAAVSLDLAILYAEQGQASRVVELAAHILEVYGTMSLHREAIAVLQLLSDALDSRKVPIVLLRRAKLCLEKHHRNAILRRTPD